MQFALTINGRLAILLLASTVIASFATTTRGGLETYDIDYFVESEAMLARIDASACRESDGAVWKQIDRSAIDAYTPAYVPIQDNAPMQFWRGGGGG